MIVNGTDLYVWISTELVAYSTSYTLSVEQEIRPGTNKGSGTFRKALPGMLNISGSVDGLYVFAGSYATLLSKVTSRTPVRLYFGKKDSVSGLLDTTTEFMSGDFLITSLEITASDAENATYSASFTYYDSFGTVSGLTPPTVVTGRAIGATTTTVGLNGNVTSDGGSVVTDRGFVWNINGNPTLADNSFSDGTGTGTYSEVITGLIPGTPYFYRAYATNAAGTSYGTQATFTTVAEAVPSYFWIAPNGSDTTGDGEFNTPWLTLAYAISQVPTGSTINLKVGTYTLTSQIVLPVGISLRGQGDNTIIRTTAALDPIILLSSAAEGTNGNQSISHLQIDGDLTALTLIKVFARSNVKIHDCTFIDAVEDGVQFYGRTDELYQFTTTYSTGNEFYNNTMTNCASYGVYDTWRYIHGCLCFGGQSGMLIHDNTITVSDRGAANGAPISFTNRGNHMGTKIYNNTLYTPPKKAETGSGGGYAFAIEMWSQRGGVEVYDNDITGAIDVGGYDTNDDGGYGYALKIYRNTIGIPALSAYNHYLLHLELGVHDGTFIYQNYFYNASRPVTFTTTSSALVQGQEDIYIYYNIFNNVRKSGTGWFGYCFDINPSVAVTIHNLQILNNVVYAPTELLYAFIQSNDATTTFTDMVVRNNIVSNAHACVEITNGTVTGINVDNNDFYNTSHQTDYTGSTVTGDTLNNNITADPLFVTAGSDFHLQAGSPCINVGIATGLSFITTDYDGQAISSPPDIGAYEYV